MTSSNDLAVYGTLSTSAVADLREEFGIERIKENLYEAVGKRFCPSCDGETPARSVIYDLTIGEGDEEQLVWVTDGDVFCNECFEDVYFLTERDYAEACRYRRESPHARTQPNQGDTMIQNLITDLVCIDCNANLMRNLAEDGALFDTAKGNGGTSCDGNDFGVHSTERVNTHLIAWFTVGSASAPVTDDDFNPVVTIPLASAFTVDDENGEAALEFIYDALTDHFGVGRWINAGQGLRDDESGTVGIDFDLNV